MNSMELMKIDRRSLIARLNEDGTVYEYVVGSYYDGKQWNWGHYFGKDLAAAVKYISIPYGGYDEELAKNIAHYCFFEGCNNTTEGNWVFDVKDLEQMFGTCIDGQMRDAIKSELFKNLYVLEVWDEGDEIDITFSTLFTQED